jgi:hypothetical protein
MLTYVWRDRRLLGFDAVEWSAWASVIAVLAVATLIF